MKWNTNQTLKPYHGQKRTVSMFALAPVHCKNGESAWLEKITMEQEYRIDPTGHWVNNCFV